MRDRELYATILGVEAPRTVERVELYGAPERLRDREGGDVESRGQGLIGWVSKLWRLMTALPAAVEVIDAATWEALQRLARRDLRPALDVPPEPGGRPEVGERRASPG